MSLNVIHKSNNKLKCLYRKSVFLTLKLRGLLCNALIQLHFDYACSVWYQNLTKKLQHRIQTTQNKCMRFCLQLDKLKHIFHEEFERLNWLSVTYRFKQCVNSIVFRCGTHLYMSLFLSVCQSIRWLHTISQELSDHNFWYTYVKRYFQVFFFVF